MIPNDLIDSASIAALLRMNRRHVVARVICRPGFPAPRIALSSKSRLWSRADVVRWIERETERNA